MAFLRRTNLSSLRSFRPRSAHSSSESFWSEGKQEKVPGHLFNETPPPPGESRKWESWELGWYSMLGAILAISVLALPARPDTNLTTWARKRARQELRDEGIDV